MIAILDYEAGNLTSVELAVREVGGEPCVTSDPAMVGQAERIIFPGVGAAGHCMDNLQRLGLDQALRAALAAGTPVLAICIGIQLLFDRSEEDGGVACLGLLPGEVVRFRFPQGAEQKVPHMGWNVVEPALAHPVLAGLRPGDECYFVHSYYPLPADPSVVLARSDYGGASFCSAAGRESLVAVQFHPEKSGRVGLGILEAFLRWDGSVPVRQPA
jgi:glutamine amidotransferase